MKYREYFNNKLLENRVRRLERLVYERSVGRSGEPSKAYLLWDYLSQNGPKTAAELQATNLRQDVTSNAALRFFLNNNLITKDGDRYSANLNYNWDDVGVLPRTTLQEIQRELAASEDENSVEDDESPQTSRSRRTQREPRARQIKPNLFSRKLEEVKAAVEAGQDPTTANDKGKTPLMFACADPKGQSGEIIEYLLEHGANANDVDGNRPVLHAVCKTGDSRGIKALVNHGADVTSIWKRQLPIYTALIDGKVRDDALVSLVSARDTRKFITTSLVQVLMNYLNSNEITDNLFSDIVERLSRDKKISEVVSPYDVYYELYHNHRNLLDLYIKNGYFPRIRRGDVGTAGNIRLGNYGINALCEAIDEAIKGNIKVSYPIDFIDVANIIYTVLNKDKSNLLDFITADWLNAKENVREANSLLNKAIIDGNRNIINKFIKAKYKGNDETYKSIISRLAYASDGTGPRSVTREVCRVLNNALPDPSKFTIGGYDMSNVVTSTDKYFLEYLIDHGYGQQMLDFIASNNYFNNVSKELLEVLKENKLSIKSTLSQSDKQRIEDNQRTRSLIKRIVDCIEGDTWSQSLNRYVDANPEILRDERILDAIANNPDSITANQLQRRIDRLPEPEKDTYDM